MQIYSWVKPVIVLGCTFGLGVASTVVWNRWRITKIEAEQTDTQKAANHQVLLGLFRTRTAEYLLNVTEWSLSKESLRAFVEILKGHVRQLYIDNGELRAQIAHLMSPRPIVPNSPSKNVSESIDSGIDLTKV